MKLNRKWIMVLALVMSMAMATTGTLAYLTDRDSEANVFTMGNVEIDLNEEFDPEDAELIPGVNIEKKPTITNTGKNDAWVWATIAIPAALDNDDASKNVVHFNYSKESVAAGLWNWKNSEGVWNVAKNVKNEEDGVEYNVYTVLYDTILKPGETTKEPVIYKVYMDPHVDIDPKGDLYHVENGVAEKLDWNINTNGNPIIYVSAYAIQTEGFANVQAGYEAYNAQWGDKGAEYGEADDEIDSEIPVFYTGDPAELAKLLSEATDASSGDVTVSLNESYDMTGFDWEPIEVDGYHGAGIVTVEGNGNTIKGLNAPLFAGGFAGESGIVIKDLTIVDSEMTAPTTQGSGTFICCADSMTTITLDNCHAKNVTLNGASRTGGLIGWTSGYSRADDGPVKSYVTINNCTVEGCTINADEESAGGFIGHSGASDWTFTTVTNSKVIDTVINGGSDRTGIYVGTSNVGETTFTGCSYDNVTGDLNDAHPLYGRTAHGSTGKLVIDGESIN